MIPTTVRLNGKLYTRNSVSIRLNGAIPLIGVESAEWSDDVPHELVQGMNQGGVPLGKAPGNYACSSSISLYADEAPTFETALLLSNPLAGTNLTAVTFQLTISFREDVRTRLILIAGCNVTGRPTRTVSNDGAALVNQYALQPTYIVEDGKTLVNLLPSF